MPLPRTPSFRLDGKRALVTGASSGIGRGCAAALAEAGAMVMCVARGAERLEETVLEIRAAGGDADAICADMSDLSELRGILHSRRPFDVCVNSAGLARHSPAVETTVEDFDAVMAINLRSAYFLSTGVASGLMEAGLPGSIIHISSQMAHVGGPDRAVYCASKHALEGMAKAMAIEWGPHRIRVNTICPTFIRTPFTEPTFADPERVAWIEGKIKLGRVGEISDIMGAVLYLATDASALVTGTSIRVDGGWTAE